MLWRNEPDPDLSWHKTGTEVPCERLERPVPAMKRGSGSPYVWGARHLKPHDVALGTTLRHFTGLLPPDGAPRCTPGTADAKTQDRCLRPYASPRRTVP